MRQDFIFVIVLAIAGLLVIYFGKFLFVFSGRPACLRGINARKISQARFVHIRFALK